MNSRHRKTLAAVFREPVSAGIAWSDVEALFLSLGCEIVEGNGSRVRFDKVGRLAFFTDLTRKRRRSAIKSEMPGIT
jgi:hypothetical protein